MRNNNFNLTATVGLIVGIAGLVVSSGCAKPPTREMADAEAAVTAAKMAEADVYAPEKYKSAEDMLSQAKGEMQKKEYKSAKDSAIKTIGLAGSAKDEAVLAKEKAKGEANNVLSELKTAIDDADRAGARRFYPSELKELDNALGELRTAYQTEKYPQVISQGREAIAGARKLADMSRVAAAEDARKSEEARRKAEEDDARRKMEEARRAAEEEEARRQAEIARRDEEEKARRKGVKPQTHTVVKGECLWTISKYEDVYQNPFMWPLIYKENRSQIRDPDLIFPKQELKIPRNHTDDQAKKAVHTAQHRGPWSLYDGK